MCVVCKAAAPALKCSKNGRDPGSSAALIRLGAVVDRHCSAKPLDSRHDRGFGFDVRYNLVVLPLELL